MTFHQRMPIPKANLWYCKLRLFWRENFANLEWQRFLSRFLFAGAEKETMCIAVLFFKTALWVINIVYEQLENFLHRKKFLCLQELGHQKQQSATLINTSLSWSQIYIKPSCKIQLFYRIWLVIFKKSGLSEVIHYMLTMNHPMKLFHLS